MLILNGQSLDLDIQSLRSTLCKPLRPSWITPDSSAQYLQFCTSYHAVICCTASRRVIGTEASEDGYIQGAGDDSEGWSYGLTPALFWKHQQQLLEAVEEDIPDIIQQFLIAKKSLNAGDDQAVKVGPTDLYIGNLASATQPGLYDGVVICSDQSPSISDLDDQGRKNTKILHLPCGEGKLGSRALRSQLPRLSPFLDALLSKDRSPKLLFACSSGKDLSVGVALTVLSVLYDDDCMSYPTTSAFLAL